MDERVVQLKRLKKASIKAKRKKVLVWKILGISFLMFAVLFSAATPVAFLLDNAVAAVSDGTFWEVVNPDSGAVYFQADSEQVRREKGEALAYQLEAEGAVLLQNSGVLPLAAGTKISAVSVPDSLKANLEKSGLMVVSDTEKADAAIVVLCADAELTQQEKADLGSAAKMKKNGSVKAIVVLATATDIPSVEFLQNNKYSVDAVLWIGDAKTQAVADLVTGKVNPSGALSAALSVDGDYQDHEARYQEYVTGNTEGYLYADNVAFPFGYGLSYTTFAYTGLKPSESENSGWQIQVGVTNTGDAPGKHIVQVYAQSGAEGTTVHLVGFAKTQIIQPGSTEAVTIQLDWKTLASMGNCFLTVASDAHEGINNILCAKGYNAANTDGRLDHEGDMAMTVSLLQGAAVEVTEEQPAIIDMHLDVQDAKQYENAEMPTTNAKNGLKLSELRGVPFEDLKWQRLMDQLSFEDMVSLLGDNYGWKKPAASVHAPGVRDYESSRCLTAVPQITEFASAKVMASTFNTELLYQVGNLMGNDCLAAQMLYIYDPAGECTQDEVLSEAVRDSLAKGVAEKGVIVAEQTDSVPQLLPYDERDLYSYRQDPQVVTAMREICHRYLYALVNSAAMNGIGPDSRIQMTIPCAVLLIPAIAAGLWVLLIPALILWIRGRKKWKKTPEFLDYRTLKTTLKGEKRAR